MEGEIPPDLVFGPNMAIRSSLFHAGNRFDESIGPRGVSYPMGSETELVLRLHRGGHRAMHVQNAVIEHFVRGEQLTEKWVMARAIRFGRGQHRLRPNLRLWGRIPRHLYRDLPLESLRMFFAWSTRRREALLRSRWKFNFLLGTGIEARFIAHEQEQIGRRTGHQGGDA